MGLSDWEKSEAGSEAGRTGERIFMHFPLVLWKPLDNWKVLGLGRTRKLVLREGGAWAENRFADWGRQTPTQSRYSGS